MQFENVIVPKPWGKEYLLYENEHVAIWHLFINAGQKTSLHAHPNKKTGLLMLSGNAQISFLNDDFEFKSCQKTMIRHGVFHRTTALDTNVQLIEIETPVNKGDIVRLKDEYGRSGKPYEGPECYEPFHDKPTISTDPIELGDCILRFCYAKTQEEVMGLSSIHDKFVVCGGSIHAFGVNVLGPGDIVNNVSISRLASEFAVDNLHLIAVDHK